MFRQIGDPPEWILEAARRSYDVAAWLIVPHWITERG
jgi:hypothetical protein